MAKSPVNPRIHWLPMVIMACLAVTGAILFRDLMRFDTLARHHESLITFRDDHYLLSVAALMSVYLVIVILSTPGATVTTLAGGFLFGTFPGVIYNVVAATLGACVLFAAVRWGAGDILARRIESAGGRTAAFKRALDRNMTSFLLLIRLAPVVPFFVANLVPAFLGVPFRPYLFTTFFGIMPGAIVYTALGSNLGDLFAQGEAPDMAAIFAPQFLWPIIGLCVLSVLPVFLRGKKGADFAADQD